MAAVLVIVTVSGFTITSRLAQLAHVLRSAIQKARSGSCSLGLCLPCFSAVTCCRRARFSRTSFVPGLGRCSEQADQKGQEEDRGLSHSGRRVASTHGRGNRQPAAEATSEYLRTLGPQPRQVLDSRCRRDSDEAQGVARSSAGGAQKQNARWSDGMARLVGLAEGGETVRT